MSKQVMACAVCGAVLDTVVDRAVDEVVGYQHTQQALGLELPELDHVVVPVPVEDLSTVELKCDFCYRPTTRAEGWALPANDFALPHGGGDYVGAWIACAGCFRLIDLDYWNKLIVRAAIGAAEEHERLGMQMPPAREVEEFLSETFALLRANITGKAVPLDR